MHTHARTQLACILHRLFMRAVWITHTLSFYSLRLAELARLAVDGLKQARSGWQERHPSLLTQRSEALASLVSAESNLHGAWGGC